MTRPTTSVWGVGTSTFGRQPDRHVEDLAWSAISEALDAAAVDPTEIDAVIVGNVFGPSGVGSRIVRACGLTDVPVMRVEAACASGTVAVHEAVTALEQGRFERVLVVGFEQLSLVFDGAIVPERSDVDGAAGLALPALYGLQAQRYLECHDVTVEDLAAVAVKNRAAGAANERAHRQTAVSADEVLASRPIAGPLTVLQCSPMSDGAAAAVIGPARDCASDVDIVGTAVVGGRAWPVNRTEPWGFASVQRVARQLEQRTGRSVSDAHVFEVHDAFTIGELVTVEALGLAPLGEGVHLLRDGDLAPGGRWPTNPSGGLLARGHPLGATGVAQLAEIVWQLTGRAGDRQLDRAELGVVETMGGGASGLDGNVAAALMLAGR